METLSWIHDYKKTLDLYGAKAVLRMQQQYKMLVKDCGGAVNSQKNPGEKKVLGALSISGSGGYMFHKQCI